MGEPQLPCIAVCRAGLEAVVAEALVALGLQVERRGVRMVCFMGDLGGFYRACRALRCAVQVLRPIRQFRADDDDRFYQQACRVPWPRLFSPAASLRIDIKGNSPIFTDQRFLTQRLKDAVVDTFRAATGGQRPTVDRDAPDVRIVAYLFRDEVTLYLDGAGAPLNERGYRPEAGEAPLKEDLAAGLLARLDYGGQAPFIDPLAGSGTLAIEAVWRAQRRAPNRDRPMAFQHWSDYNADLDQAVRSELRAAERPLVHPVLACEQDPATAAVLQRNLARAGLTGAVTVHQGPFQTCRMTLPGATILTNPPYGERLTADLPALYRDLETWASRHAPGGRLAVFTLATTPTHRLFSLPVRPEKGFFNGNLPAKLAHVTLPLSSTRDGI